jgi:hypothetical protein
MKAKIKSFHSVDVDDLWNFNPDNPDNFSFVLELMVGPDNEKGAESFDIQVCTPKWFLTHLKKDDVVAGRHFLIVLEYNFENLFNKIKELIEMCIGNDWNEVAQKVSRIGFWEFEDYTSLEK